MTASTPRESRFEPSAALLTPERVRDDATLTNEQKIDILRQWAYDDAELAVAVEEGMPDTGRGGLLRRILLALGALSAGVDLERSAPTKQHGLTIASSRAPSRAGEVGGDPPAA